MHILLGYVDPFSDVQFCSSPIERHLIFLLSLLYFCLLTQLPINQVVYTAQFQKMRFFHILTYC